MAKFCSNCGNALSGTEKFCGSCGTPIITAEPAKEEPAVEAVKEETPASEPVAEETPAEEPEAEAVPAEEPVSEPEAVEAPAAEPAAEPVIEEEPVVEEAPASEPEVQEVPAEAIAATEAPKPAPAPAPAPPPPAPAPAEPAVQPAAETPAPVKAKKEKVKKEKKKKSAAGVVITIIIILVVLLGLGIASLFVLPVFGVDMPSIDLPFMKTFLDEIESEKPADSGKNYAYYDDDFADIVTDQDWVSYSDTMKKDAVYYSDSDELVFRIFVEDYDADDIYYVVYYSEDDNFTSSDLKKPVLSDDAELQDDSGYEPFYLLEYSKKIRPGHYVFIAYENDKCKTVYAVAYCEVLDKES